MAVWIQQSQQSHFIPLSIITHSTHTHTLLQLASSQRATQYKLTRSNYGGRGGRNWEKERECVCVRKTVRFIERAKRNMKEKERVRSFPPSIHYEPNCLELAVGCSWFHHDNHCGNGQEIKTLTRATSTSTVHTGHFKEVMFLLSWMVIHLNFNPLNL